MMPITVFAALIVGVILAGALTIALAHAAGGASALTALLLLGTGAAWLVRRFFRS